MKAVGYQESLPIDNPSSFLDIEIPIPSATGRDLLVEIKAVRALDDVHSAQCLNYLKATGHRLRLLINFAKPRVEVRRIVLDL